MHIRPVISYVFNEQKMKKAQTLRVIIIFIEKKAQTLRVIIIFIETIS